MANRSFYEFFKAKPEETLGQMIYDLGNKQWNIPKLRELLETILPQKTSFDNFVVEHEFASIGRRTMLLNARQIQRAFGKEKIILLAIEDITDRNAWEHSFLELNERLLVSNRELEALGHSLSHDLRGPIQSIEAFSSILLEGYAEKLDAEGTQIVKSVKETAHRMYDMIFGLLSISRIARAEIRRDIIDLTTLFRMIAKEHRAAEPVRNIKVLVQENLFAQGDAKLIRMALDNLFRNAWKFTRKRTEARIEFGETYSRGKTAFFLRDNGAGFDMKHAEKIFTVFQRLHSDEEFEGTGVGLATVERIIRRHGGEIWAEGEVDKGAVFYFTLK
jgi:light-regulated signal transduction histidine kinase (bacteriophytochrome)